MNSIEARMIFENAKASINAAFGDVNASKKFKLTMSTLRLEQALVAGQTLYTFPILTNDTSLGIFNTETRLKQQDSFVMAQMGYYIGNPGSAANAAWLPDTYPNPFTYGANAVPMQALYNGNIKITVDNDVLVYNWDLMKHLYIPQTQATAAPAASSPIDQKRLDSDGLISVEPTITFIGTKDNLIQVILTAAPASFNANARIGLWMRGVNAQSSTVMSKS